MIRLRRVAALLICLPSLWGCQAQAAFTQGISAKIWVDRYQEIEEYLRTAECVSMQMLIPGALARCTFRPGGPVARMAWRSPPPGTIRGFRERYKTEIAAYALDKLLKMDMVPPSVERQLQGVEGGAQLWVEGVVDATDPAAPNPAEQAHWEGQLVRMAMFDNLIGNRDRNRQNMLRDRAWNLILLDHSRAFGSGLELPHKLSRIDDAYWARIDGLTRSQLDAALGAWIGDNEIQAILERRERMRADIKSLPR